MIVSFIRRDEIFWNIYSFTGSIMPLFFQTGASWGERLMSSLTKSPSITPCSPEPSSFARRRGVDRPWMSRFCALLWQITEFCLQISTKKPSNILFKKEKEKSEPNRWCWTRKNYNCNLVLESSWFFHSIVSYVGVKRHVRAASGWSRRGSQVCCVDNWYINGKVDLQWLQTFFGNFVQLQPETSCCFRTNTNPVSTFRL